MTTQLMRYTILLIIAVSSFCPFLVSSQSFCGGAGYDVTSASQVDLTINSGNWNWTVHPCGSVTSVAVCANETYGTMFCQSSGSTSWSIANYNSTILPSVRWLAISNGVQMTVQDGEYCAAARSPREATIQFICDNSATTAVLTSVTEPEVCWYQAVIRTASACFPSGPTAQTGQIGASFWSTQCGGGVYDLSTVAAQDLYFDTIDYRYWIRVCGYVSNTTCAPALPTSFCQIPTWVGGFPVDASYWNSSVAQVWTVTSTGISVNIHDGDRCAVINGDRQATINFVCNPYITRPRLSYVYEPEICEYVAVVQTPAVCNGRNEPELGYCGGAGYDLTALGGLDLRTVYNGYTWYISPCSIITVPNICSGSQSMMCQVSADGWQWNIASWNRTIAPTVTWLAISGGVQYTTAFGESCGGNGLREVSVQFICNQTSFDPWIQSVTEPETCWYFVRIHTMYACDYHDGTAPHVPGSTYYDSVCGGSIYDFGNIQAQGDLVFDSNSSSLTSGYKYYINLCGVVANSSCAIVQPSMFCQVPKAFIGAYSLAAMNESSPAIYTVNTNGLTMTVEDGTPCGAVPERRASIQIVCDGTTPASISSVRETESCRYSAVLHAQCNYMPGQNPLLSSTASQPLLRSSSSSSASSLAQSSSSLAQSSSSSSLSNSSQSLSSGAPVAAPASSSSSLSGGAVAGIVIGSIAGFMILLAVVLVVCCGACGLGRSKKSTEDYAGSGKFNEMDHAEQSRANETDSHHGEVEMEETS